jgi:hypothetical protein
MHYGFNTGTCTPYIFSWNVKGLGKGWHISLSKMTGKLPLVDEIRTQTPLGNLFCIFVRSMESTTGYTVHQWDLLNTVVVLNTCSVLVLGTK